MLRFLVRRNSVQVDAKRGDHFVNKPTSQIDLLGLLRRDRFKVRLGLSSFISSMSFCPARFELGFVHKFSYINVTLIRVQRGRAGAARRVIADC